MPKWAIEYTMAWMSVGDSMFIPTLDPTPIISKCRRAANKLGFEVTIKATCENYIKGVRVWRDG